MLLNDFSFSHHKVRVISKKVLQHTAFFAHPENVIVSILSDEDEHIIRAAVQTAHSLHLKARRKSAYSVITPLVYQFCLPKLDFKAKPYD